MTFGDTCDGRKVGESSGLIDYDMIEAAATVIVTGTAVATFIGDTVETHSNIFKRQSRFDDGFARVKSSISGRAASMTASRG